MAIELDAVEARVLGSLVEKQLTTPQHYPLTLNALLAACNQSSNRDPVVAYDAETVERALARLREVGLVRLVHPSHGGRTPKHRHVVDEQLGLDVPSLAVLCVLLLRGPQTDGLLRSRTERMHSFASLDEVESTLQFLAGRDQPLVRKLERKPGQKEPRWEHLLSGAASSRFDALDYVILYVDDIERALAFWTGTLGMQLKHRDGAYAQLDTGTTRLALLERAALHSTLGLPADARFEVGFLVDDVDAAHARLLAAGVTEVVAPADRVWGQRTSYVQDPDGHLVELAMPIDTSSADTQPVSTDDTPPAGTRPAGADEATSAAGGGSVGELGLQEGESSPAELGQ